MYAQTTTTVSVEVLEALQQTNWTDLMVSFILGAATIGVASWAVIEARSTRNSQRTIAKQQTKLDRRMNRLAEAQHRWESSDRTPRVRVTVVREAETLVDGREAISRYLRFTNTGALPAMFVNWDTVDPDHWNMLTNSTTKHIDELPAGESYEVRMRPVTWDPRTDDAHAIVRVEWAEALSEDEVKYHAKDTYVPL